MNKKKMIGLLVVIVVVIAVACFCVGKEDKTEEVFTETEAEDVKEPEKEEVQQEQAEEKSETKVKEDKKEEEKQEKEEEKEDKDVSAENTTQSAGDTGEIYVGPLVDKGTGQTESQPQESQPEPITFPYSVPGTGIVVQKISSYDGVYIEDGSDQEISNVAAMLMTNSSGNAIEYVSVSLKCDGELMEFEASDIPSGAAVLVQEKNKKSYSGGTYTECIGTAAQMDGFGMAEDQVKVTPNEDDTFTVTNLTEQTIPCVRLFYKLYMEDQGIYVGGITYNVKVTELEAGASQTISPSHYVQGYSRLMMVRTYDTAE